ncbi:hypothetical protein ACHAXS_011808 [Conticribra weissflogii]
MSKARAKMIFSSPADGGGAPGVTATPLTNNSSKITLMSNATPRNVRSGRSTKSPSLSSARKSTENESNPTKRRRGRPRKTPSPSPVPSKGKTKKTENELSKALSAEEKTSAEICSAGATLGGKSRVSEKLNIDEILSESDDLLRAAYEAQSLGRLSAAQSFLYLAHARLVGLGQYVESLSKVQQGTVDEEEGILGKQNTSPDATKIISTLDYLKLPVTTPSPNSLNEGDEQKDQLTDRLAYAAITLLHQRTGKGMQYEAELERKKSKQRKPMSQSFKTSSHSLGFHLEKESNTKKSDFESLRDQKVEAGVKKYEYQPVYNDIRTMSNDCAKLDARMLLVCPESKPEEEKNE